MPRRPSRLALQQPNPLHQPTKSSQLRIPPSPHSPLTPLHPPARLQLRTVLPSPLTPHTIDLAPNVPYPWIWRCHLCHSVYRLGVTRRCLEDGHLFCSLPSPPTSDDEDSQAQGRKKRKRQHTRGCRAEFDYTGWSNYNIWRREIRLFREVSSGSDSSSKSNNEQDNCWTDCDFPSECHNARAERLRAARAAAKATRTLGLPTEQLNLAQEWEAIKAGIEVREKVEEMLSETEDLDDLYLSMPAEEERIVHAERRGQEDEAKLVDVSLGDGDGSSFLIDDVVDDPVELEFAFVEKKRKKSILKIHQLTGLMLGTDVDVSTGAGDGNPSSPLKESMVASDDLVDVDLGDDSGGSKDWSAKKTRGGGSDGRRRSERLKASESKQRKETKGIDLQMEELIKSGSDFLRRFKSNDGEERFGDEG